MSEFHTRGIRDIGEEAYRLDVELDKDRRFFRKHQLRQHRVRRSLPTEKQIALRFMAEFKLTPHDDFEVYVAVQRLERGKRLRRFFLGPPPTHKDALLYVGGLDYTLRPTDFRRLNEREAEGVFLNSDYFCVSVDDVPNDGRPISLDEALKA